MPSDPRLQVVLERLAAQLEDLRAERALKKYCLMSQQVSQGTVQRVFAGKNTSLAKLVSVVDLLGGDVIITIQKR